MNDAIFNMMCVTAGFLCGAVVWRGDMLEAKTNARMLDRYQRAIYELARWCGHESPHVRIITAHIAALGDGDEPINSGTPIRDEICDVQGTREQLRRIDVEKAGNRALLRELTDISTALGTNRFMDLRDGGSMHISDQVRRMREELEGLEALMADTEWLKAELAVRMQREEQRSTDPSPAMPALQSVGVASELAVARQAVRGEQSSGD